MHTAVSAWLEAQRIGSITPRRFRQAIIDTLPTLGYLQDADICERTARRWLKKLGYTPKPTKKGVYEDGHEREDVVEYRNDIFLSLMADMDKRSVGYEPDEEGGAASASRGRAPSSSLLPRRVLLLPKKLSEDQLVAFDSANSSRQRSGTYHTRFGLRHQGHFIRVTGAH